MPKLLNLQLSPNFENSRKNEKLMTMIEELNVPNAHPSFLCTCPSPTPQSLFATTIVDVLAHSVNNNERWNLPTCSSSQLLPMITITMMVVVWRSFYYQLILILMFAFHVNNTLLEEKKGENVERQKTRGMGPMWQR
jgi:hypothetical protein